MWLQNKRFLRQIPRPSGPANYLLNLSEWTNPTFQVMEDLKDIAYFLTRYQVRVVDVLTNPPQGAEKKENRYWDFYLGLRENRWKCEEDAAAYFGLLPESKAFSRLKNEVRRRLYNTLLFIDATKPELSDYNRIAQDLMKDWAVADTLRRRGAIRAFLDLAWRCLQIALRIEHVAMVVDIAQMIKTSTFSRPNLSREYLRTKRIFDVYWPAYQAEVNLRQGYEDFILGLAANKGYKMDRAPEARSLAQEAQPLLEQYNHMGLHFYGRMLSVYAHTLCHNWEAGLAEANEALNFLRKKPVIINSYLTAFSQQKIGCLIMLGRHGETRKVLAEVETLVLEGTAGWFKNLEMTVVNALYASDYTEAWHGVKKAVAHERFREISSMDQETWRLMQGYLYFLVKAGMMELHPREKSDLFKFRLTAWLNDMSLYGQDKRGANIPVLILQMMFLLLENNTEAYYNRIEALRKYRKRNLEPSSEHFRTDCFIRLLELPLKFPHDMEQLVEAAQPLLDKLSIASNDVLDRTFEIEVVPYETQWEWVLHVWKQRRRR